MIHIAVMNASTSIADVAIQEMLPAFQQQLNEDVCSVWPVARAHLGFYAKGNAPPEGCWWIVFLDDSDQASALAYHDLTMDGLPLSKVFVKTLRADKASISVGATHEICEMAVDPWMNSAYQSPTGAFWAGEVCDPVEDDPYGYEIGGVLVTDFVTPDWFGHDRSSGRMDFKGHVKRAFDVLSGGYAQKFEHNRGWVQVTGAKAESSHRAKPARGSRRERRERGPTNWRKSEPRWE